MMVVDQATGPGLPAQENPTRPTSRAEIARCTDLVALVDRRLAECRRVRQGLALLCIDVAGHDEWAHRHGPDVAQRLLQDLALRLRGGLRQHDEVRRLSVTRLAVLLCGAGEREALLVRARLERVLAGPYRVGPWLLGPSVRVGCAASPPAPARGDTLVHLATQSLDADVAAG
ncbi:MAG: diguanylate cyclase [Vitreoscilla sp.]|nr:diguanylate cyclase [Vitreoscilla sp.]